MDVNRSLSWQQQHFAKSIVAGAVLSPMPLFFHKSNLCCPTFQSARVGFGLLLNVDLSCNKSLYVRRYSWNCYCDTMVPAFLCSKHAVLLQVALLAGCLYTAVGILKLGWITNFLSHSVICGFMTGASVIIGLSQVALFPLLFTEQQDQRQIDAYAMSCAAPL